MTEDALHLSHIARVHLVDSSRLVEILTRSGIDEKDAEDMYFWEAEISNELLDTHYTHMSEKTLRNYAEDASSGVAFLKGHDWRSLPTGYSVEGKYEEAEGRKRVVASFYTIRSLPEGADLIKRMQTKLLRDVSVGFHGGREICDVCGEDLWYCRHYPGLTYEEKHGDTVTKAIATFTIDDSRLSEVSGVFDGSTPQAMIRKAELAARAGTLTQAEASILENRYRIALPLKRSFPVTQGKEEKMTAEERLAKIRSMVGVATDEEVESRFTGLTSELTTAKARIAELEPQASDGAQYRNDLITEALEEGVRSQGTGFDKETYEETLRSASIKVIKRMRDDWKKQADKQFPAGRTTDDGDGEVTTTTVPRYPTAAYRV